MRIIRGFILATLFVPFMAISQEKIEFDIVFGNYVNDHHKKEFRAKERNWILKDDELIYFIDAHDTRYSDTIALKSLDVKSILDFIKENELNKTIIKDLQKDNLNKRGWTATIRGNINLQNETYKINLKANSPSVLYENLDAKRLKSLEDLLYKIIED